MEPGFIVIIFIVVVIIIVVVIKKNINKKAGIEACEQLKKSRVYEIAINIKEELEKKGFNFGEPYMSYFDKYAYGNISCSYGTPTIFINIYFSEFRYGLRHSKFFFRSNKALHVNNKRDFCIENDNISILVYVYSNHVNFNDVPEAINIAAEVIKKNGYGPCSFVE